MENHNYIYLQKLQTNRLYGFIFNLQAFKIYDTLRKCFSLINNFFQSFLTTHLIENYTSGEGMIKNIFDKCKKIISKSSTLYFPIKIVYYDTGL